MLIWVVLVGRLIAAVMALMAKSREESAVGSEGDWGIGAATAREATRRSLKSMLGRAG